MTEKYEPHFIVFYSWQSDLDKKANNHFIKSCLEQAIKEIKKGNNLKVIPRLDKDTEGTTGSPKIADTILKKIDASQILVADVTIINSNPRSKTLKKRLTPNPNVMFELGYGLARLGWERIICLNNTAFSDVKDMPFDLKQNRISQYHFDGIEKKPESKKQLTELLKKAIQEIIKNYENILNAEKKHGANQHDEKVFYGVDRIASDSKLLDLLEGIAGAHMLSREDYKLIDDFRNYLVAERNQFLMPEIKTESIKLLSAIGKMRGTLAANLFSNYEEWVDSATNQKMESVTFCLPNKPEHFDNYQQFEQDKDKRIEKIESAVDATMEQYRVFRRVVKQKLFI